jgi:hypothetical protein
VSVIACKRAWDGTFLVPALLAFGKGRGVTRSVGFGADRGYAIEGGDDAQAVCRTLTRTP